MNLHSWPMLPFYFCIMKFEKGNAFCLREWSKLGFRKMRSIYIFISSRKKNYFRYFHFTRLHDIVTCFKKKWPKMGAVHISIRVNVSSFGGDAPCHRCHTFIKIRSLFADKTEPPAFFTAGDINLMRKHGWKQNEFPGGRMPKTPRRTISVTPAGFINSFFVLRRLVHLVFLPSRVSAPLVGTCARR